MRHFGKSVHDYQDRIMSLIEWQVGDEVHRYGWPRPIWKCERSKQSTRAMMDCFGSSTYVTSLDDVTNTPVHDKWSLSLPSTVGATNRSEGSTPKFWRPQNGPQANHHGIQLECELGTALPGCRLDCSSGGVPHLERRILQGRLDVIDELGSRNMVWFPKQSDRLQCLWWCQQGLSHLGG